MQGDAGAEGGSPDRMRTGSARVLLLLETFLYIAVGALLAAAALVAVSQAGGIIWRGITSGQAATFALQVLDQLLLVVMLIEVLHTIRISISSKELTLVQPFLIVGLIASIRRVLVITTQAASWAEAGGDEAGAAAVAFRNAMIELALLGFLILVFVISLYLLHRTPRREDLSG